MSADICSYFKVIFEVYEQKMHGYLSLQVKDVSDNLLNFLLWIFLLTVEMYHVLWEKCDNVLAIWKSLWKQ